jgi:hypothetical protein
MEALNIQSDQIAQVVCAFMGAATPIDVISTFKNAGIGLLNDEGSLLCDVNPEVIRCLLHPLHPALPDMLTDEEDDPDEDSDSAVTPEEEQAGALEGIERRDYLRACRDAWRRRSQGASIWCDAAVTGVEEAMEARASPIASVLKRSKHRPVCGSNWKVDDCTRTR